MFPFLSSLSQIFLFSSIFLSFSTLLTLSSLLSSLSPFFLVFSTSFFHFSFTVVIFLPFLSFFYPGLSIDFFSSLSGISNFMYTSFHCYFFFLFCHAFHFFYIVSLLYLFWILDFSPFSFVYLHIYHVCLHFMHHLLIFTYLFFLLYPIFLHFSSLLLFYFTYLSPIQL